MGNNESQPIRNLDKRTARREYKDNFVSAIRKFRSNIDKSNSNVSSDQEQSKWDSNNEGNLIRVCVRKRPFFKHEEQNGEFDCITCSDNSIKNNNNNNRDFAIIHDARMHPDMKRMFLNNHEFRFDHVFDEKTNNGQVYQGAASPLIDIAINGGYSTCMVYGQTGSGKTFTMTSIYESAAHDIFDKLEEESARFDSPPHVSVSFFEIAGDQGIFDLLNAFQTTTLLSGSDGSVHPFPVVEVTVTSPEELISMINHGCNIRSTSATGVHDASSRSHAVLRIYIQKNAGNTEETNPNQCPDITSEGILTLVDLAGSEHRIDSMYHSADRRKEGANINASLMALKECVRARAAGKNLSHQYRKSKLTMCLKSAFSFPSARTVIIATVSPASKDTEHSLNTLRHACLMDSQDTDAKDKAGDETRFIVGGNVTKQFVAEVNITEISRRNNAIKKAGGEIADLKTSNGNEVLKEVVELTAKEKERMKRSAEKKSMVKMIPEHRKVLLHYRGQLGNNIRQHIRLRTLQQQQEDYGEDRVGNNSEEEELKQIQVEAAELKKKEEEKSKKFKKLYSSIYYDGSEIVPEALRRRQLITLLKMNNYTEDEIEQYSPPSPITTALKKPVESFVVEKKKAVGFNNSRTSLDTSDSDKYIEIVATRNGKDISEESSRIPRRREKETRATTAPPPPSEPTNSPRFRNMTNSPIQVIKPSNINSENSNHLQNTNKQNLNSSGSTPSLAIAAKVVESEAQKRQSRQEKAREHREKLEQERLRKLAARGIDITKKAPVVQTNDEDNNYDNNNTENIATSPVQPTIASPPIKTSRANVLANLNKKASPPPSNNNRGLYNAAASLSENVIRERQQEIIELENDLNNPNINEKIQVEIRKQIALHRTCIAREQKRSDTSRNPTEQPDPIQQQISYNSPKEQQQRHQQPPSQEWDQPIRGNQQAQQQQYQQPPAQEWEQPLNNGGHQRQQKQQQPRQQLTSQEWDQPIQGNQQYQQQQSQEWDQPLYNGGQQRQQQQIQPKRVQQQINSYNPANSLGGQGGNGPQRRPQWNDGNDEQQDQSYTAKLLKQQIFQQQGQQGVGGHEWDQQINNHHQQQHRQQQRQYPPQEWDQSRQQQSNQQRYQQPPPQQQLQQQSGIPQKKLTPAERHRLEFQAQEAREQDIKNQKLQQQQAIQKQYEQEQQYIKQKELQEQKQIRMQELNIISPPKFGRYQQRNLGAASAPFGNAYSYDETYVQEEEN